jgi:hypothetical protein
MRKTKRRANIEPRQDTLPLKVTVTLVNIDHVSATQARAMRAARLIFARWFREAEQKGIHEKHN